MAADASAVCFASATRACMAAARGCPAWGCRPSKRGFQRTDWQKPVRPVRADCSDGLLEVGRGKTCWLGRFGHLFVTRSHEASFAANALPASLRFAVAVENVVAGRNAELANNGIRDRRAELVLNERHPSTRRAKLHIGRVTIGRDQLRLAFANQCLWTNTPWLSDSNRRSSTIFCWPAVR